MLRPRGGMHVCMRKLGLSDVTCVKVGQADHCGDCGFCAFSKLELDWSGLDYKSTDYAGARIIGGTQNKNNPSRKSIKNEGIHGTYFSLGTFLWRFHQLSSLCYSLT